MWIYVWLFSIFASNVAGFQNILNPAECKIIFVFLFIVSTKYPMQPWRSDFEELFLLSICTCKIFEGHTNFLTSITTPPYSRLVSTNILVINTCTSILNALIASPLCSHSVCTVSKTFLYATFVYTLIVLVSCYSITSFNIHFSFSNTSEVYCTS